jgi:hypothetical protein
MGVHAYAAGGGFPSPAEVVQYAASRVPVYQALQFIPIHSAETTKVGQRRTREDTSGVPQGSGSKRQKPTEGEPGYKNLKGLRSD